ncbi:hypothetical protein ACRAKI_09285 [Saccharothrix isguenensis]
MSPESYWLENWMREYDITSVSEYQRAIQSPTVIKALYQEIPEHLVREPSLKVEPYTVMAGRSLDLSASFYKACFACLRSELGVAVTRTAHYFDKLAVSGPIADKVMRDLGSGDKDRRARVLRDLQAHVAIVNYINNIGARDRVKFVAKPSGYCQGCYSIAAREAGITIFDDEKQRNEIVEQIVKTSRIITVRDRAGSWMAKISGPMIIGNQSKVYGRDRPSRHTVAEDMFYAMSYPVVQDFMSSKRYKLPVVDIGETDWTHLQKGSALEKNAHEVALKVELPAITGIGLEDYIRLEQDEQSSFIKFQAAVRSAIQECVKRYDSAPPDEVAQAVVDEFIKPELANIEQKLKVATRSLGKKVGASVAVGATVTSIGLVAAMPIVTAAGIAAAATWLTQLHKFYDDRSGVESSEMYFLWKLARAPHGSSHS